VTGDTACCGRPVVGGSALAVAADGRKEDRLPKINFLIT